jgi:hypothetical protein
MSPSITIAVASPALLAMMFAYQPSGIPVEPLSSSSVMSVTTRIASSRTKPSLQPPGIASSSESAPTIALIAFSLPSPSLPTFAAHWNAADRSGCVVSM